MKKLSKKRVRFSVRPLLVKKEPRALEYLSQRATFWIAVFSLLAFVTGNMMGQHGWEVFWKSVLGGTDDSLIVYSGTVPPIARVPDYTRWSTYGGNPQVHTYAEVPTDLVVALPAYDALKQRSNGSNAYYSVGYMGSYATGAEGDGSHPAVDIRVPVGTPVQSIAMGFVSKVVMSNDGFGNYIVVRHPHMPDPSDGSKTTTLFSIYAHLSAVTVAEGDIVQKGQVIGASGQSGDASGPHLHFQIDRDVGTDGVKVAFHPFWPFTGAEARAAGMTDTEAINKGLNQLRGFADTVNPLVYVTQHLTDAIAQAPVRVASAVTTVAQRREARLIRRGVTTTLVAMNTPFIPSPSSSSSSQSSVVSSVAESSSSLSVAASSSSVAQTTVAGTFSTLSIEHSGSFDGKSWETVTIHALDANGNVVAVPAIDGKLYLRTAYGSAQFNPPTLTPNDFHDGVATVKMLPLGHTTVVVEVQPGAYMSDPMKWSK